jgi:hypothetical protein
VLLILLTGGTKKRQHRDIDAAKALWANDVERSGSSQAVLCWKLWTKCSST